MDMSVLHDFAVLAERLNYAAAARELGMAQSTLSRHISDLERELRATLFSRGAKLELTPCGRVLLEETGEFFATEERLARRLAEAKRIARGTVRLEDYVFSQSVKNFMLQGVYRFKESYPGVLFEFTPVKLGRPITDALAAGEFDVGVLVHCGTEEPEFAERDQFRVVPLWHERSRMGVYLRKDALTEEEAARDAIGIDVFGRLPIVLPLRPEYANFKADMTALCEAHGFTPTFRLLEMKSFETLAMLDMRGCAQVVLEYDMRDSSSLFRVNSECGFYLLEPACYATPYLLMSRERSNPVLDAFADCLERLGDSLRA